MERFNGNQFDCLSISSDNGLALFKLKTPKRQITFSQELPFPNPGVDIRPLTAQEQIAHLEEAGMLPLIDYVRAGLTEHA